MAYIEREALLAEYDRQHKGPPGKAREIIENFPAADVRPVVYGEWIFSKPPVDWIMDLYTCNQCGHIEDGQPHFCPFCGADMYGGRT